MTKIYFVRHAEPDKTVIDDRNRPLTAQGLEDTRFVYEMLKNKDIDVAISSPYKPGEYDFVAKQLYQVKDAEPLLMDIAKGYQENEELIAALDSVYGSGSAKYIGEAIESFYTSPSKIFQ